MAAPRWPFSRAAPGIGLYTTPLKSIRSSFSSRAFPVVLPCPPDSGPLQRFPVPTAFPVVVQIPGFSANPAASTSLGVPVVLQCPWILGLYNGFHFPQGFPWFSVSLDSGPLHRLRLSKAFPVVLQSPRNLGLCRVRPSPDLFSPAFPVLLQCPWILGLSNAFYFIAFPMVFPCPRIPGLYTGFHFPRRFPWVCRVPGFWASSANPTSHGISHGFSSGPGFKKRKKKALAYHSLQASESLSRETIKQHHR